MPIVFCSSVQGKTESKKLSLKLLIVFLIYLN